MYAGIDNRPNPVSVSAFFSFILKQDDYITQCPYLYLTTLNQNSKKFSKVKFSMNL